MLHSHLGTDVATREAYSLLTALCQNIMFALLVFFDFLLPETVGHSPFFH